MTGLKSACLEQSAVRLVLKSELPQSGQRSENARLRMDLSSRRLIRGPGAYLKRIGVVHQFQALSSVDFDLFQMKILPVEQLYADIAPEHRLLRPPDERACASWAAE